MLDVEPPIAGFTTWAGEGHGFGFANASISERVRGRVKRTILVAVLTRENVAPLLALIAERAPLPHLTCWIEAVEGFGQLQRSKAGRNAAIAICRGPSRRRRGRADAFACARAHVLADGVVAGLHLRRRVWGIAVLASRQPDAESEIVLRLTRPAAGANSDRTPASGPLDAPHRGHRDGEA